MKDVQKLMGARLHTDVKAPSAVESRKALRHLLGRAEAQFFADGAAAEMKRLIDTRDEGQRSEAEEILQLQVVKLLRQAGKLSFEEFVFIAGRCIYDVHDRKLVDGSYDKQVKPIVNRIDAIERKAGLAQDQFWLRDDGPLRWQELNRRYDAVTDRLLAREMRSFKLKELADLFRDDRNAFDLAFEQGRRSIFHKDDVRNAVARLVSQYEFEAKRSESGGAFYASMVMYGAACEARLLLRVLDSPVEAEAARERLKEKKPRHDRMKWTLDDLIRVGVEAGWLKGRDEKDVELPLEAWATTLRLIRNLLHPGRHALEHPHVAVGDTQVHDAKAAYAVISRVMDTRRISSMAIKGTRRR